MFKYTPLIHPLRSVRPLLTSRAGITDKTTASPGPQPKYNDQFSLLHGNISPTLRTFTNAAATPEVHSRILPLLKHEHAELQSHSHKILNSIDSDEQSRYQNQFTWELARNTIGKELLVYPAIAKHVRHGQVLADKNRAEHREIKEQLKMFQGLPCTDPRFAPTLEALAEDLRVHVRREEEEDLVLLEEALSREDSEALAGSLDRMKRFLPSRAHPLTPSKPPFETAVGLLTAPVDMVGDLFRKWPHGGVDRTHGREGSKHLAAAR
ncbi:hypothetical protein N7466_008740 [Penicillium verhagenii]|uniref:uncharacterized protein n=1 Tax=Penicillium verhagenii TaxID=1562060 RepID=UPI002544FEEB|nr:uncharacterized protein N7466_008740 [Penicillium verhagenii]KAJ5924553.1 hypothetical protein N7466_008740 [Penicillium verhagenii]